MAFSIRLLVGLLGATYLVAGVAALVSMARLMAPTVRFIRTRLGKPRAEE